MSVEIVAEFTTNHLGNMTLLHRMVQKAKAAGADSVKLQRKDIDAFYTQEQLDRPYASPCGKTYREYREAFELFGNDWQEVFWWCEGNKIPWFVTPQDLLSLEWAVGPCYCGESRIKLSSTNARNREFVQHAANVIPTDYEIVVSVAGQTLPEIERIVNLFRDHCRLWILHCVAEYPCPPERLRLGNIAELRKHFGCDQIHIGYSGHEVGYLPTLAAVEQFGAEMIERHFCMSRNSFAHHIECSLEPDEFKAMVDAVRDAHDNGNQAAYESVPAEAYRTEFGISEQERPFLENQQYGR
ncbi:hypothetical protein LCGC14_0336220 [marine sediment metagenome]|uniref:PseI/NeuA/B-like domain-containing protein n=1 Tax=marine sediment metagenome TaxID=412755 RepID=A0A0F9TXW5_9ZZZZ